MTIDVRPSPDRTSTYVMVDMARYRLTGSLADSRDGREAVNIFFRERGERGWAALSRNTMERIPRSRENKKQPRAEKPLSDAESLWGEFKGYLIEEGEGGGGGGGPGGTYTYRPPGS